MAFGERISARGPDRQPAEMELVNTRLASFTRKAGIALAAVTAAAAAADVAMVQSGLDMIGALADMTRRSEATAGSGSAVGALYRLNPTQPVPV